jgi:hypothetical protein
MHIMSRLSGAGSYRQLPAVTGSYRQLPAGTGSYRQLPAVTGSYRQLPAGLSYRTFLAQSAKVSYQNLKKDRIVHMCVFCVLRA